MLYLKLLSCLSVFTCRQCFNALQTMTPVLNPALSQLCVQQSPHATLLFAATLQEEFKHGLSEHKNEHTNE